MASLREIIKTKKPETRKFILDESKTKVNKVQPTNRKIEILGVVYNFNNEVKTYYIGYDGDNYYLFTGSVCGSLFEGDWYEEF